MFGFRKKEKTTDAGDRIKHIAFIMDGNGRWAKKRGLPREYGHSVGAKTFEDITEYCKSIGIKNVTVYAFSTENWKRPENEVNEIMRLFGEYLIKAKKTMMEKDVKIRIIGDTSRFDDKTRALINEIETESAGNSLGFNIAVNYGGRAEIVNAVNRLIKSGDTEITEEKISQNLYTADIPEPDLIVRTGSEMRLSNFLMWQSAYSELYFTDTLWPDMTHEDVDRAVAEFMKRKRRFGGV